MLEGYPGRRKNVTGPERDRSRGADAVRELAMIYGVEIEGDADPDSIAAMDRPQLGTETPGENTSAAGAGRRRPTTPSRSARPKTTEG